VRWIGGTARVAVVAVAMGVGLVLGYAAGERGEGLTEAWAQQDGAVLTDEQAVVRAVQMATPTVVSVAVPRRGAGSGVIIREDGVILTNYHVVQGARTVEVGLADGTSHTGQVLGGDPGVDIAVVRIQARGLPVAPLADSDRLQPGQSAIAIGNPLGLERSVTRGVISAVNRAPPGLRMEELIQTDAAINPGNSGGPLLDSQGRVVGINTVILRGDPRTTPTGAVGLGFAVPINLAADIANQLLTTGRIRRAFLGINYQDLDPELVRQYRLPVASGIVLLHVEPNSPAGRAGLRRGDIVTRFGETPVTTGGDLRRAIRNAQPGQTVDLRVHRPPAEAITVRVRLGEVTI
jgi:serine protease Do